MLLLQGGAALSAFRAQRLIEYLRDLVIKAGYTDVTVTLTTRTIYLVDTTNLVDTSDLVDTTDVADASDLVDTKNLVHTKDLVEDLADTSGTFTAEMEARLYQLLPGPITPFELENRPKATCLEPERLEPESLFKSALIEPENLSTAETQLTLNYWVVPRQGTLSPWSSKTQDIIRLCGITGISSIEQGIYYQFSLQVPSTPLSTLPSNDRINTISQEINVIPEEGNRISEGINTIPQGINAIQPLIEQSLKRRLYDPLMQDIVTELSALDTHRQSTQPIATLTTIPIRQHGKSALLTFNAEQALGLSDVELDYLLTQYQALDRDPTDAELMMFAQVNSEHCRHKVFNAQWTIDQAVQSNTLFGLIKSTDRAAQSQPNYPVQVAYHDNAAVMGSDQGIQGFWSDPKTHQYAYYTEPHRLVFKVETHNHPTAVSPHPGAATGSGGEIRDEGATGRGATIKAGLVGFSVSHLHVPDSRQPWETAFSKPSHFASPLAIMLEAPIGAAAYNNEFGRPNILGYFRSFYVPPFSNAERVTAETSNAATSDAKPSLTSGAEPSLSPSPAWGYHKPIMLAGGVGRIRASAMYKSSLLPGTPLIVLGGPAMAIGLGGGSASSQAGSAQREALDFASVQRANPEMERRCQSVIDACWALGEHNPIVSIHDVGAGGLSNALPELVAASERGGAIELRKIPNAEPSMSPLAIWCNEAQERYVLAIAPEQLTVFQAIAQRERCPMAVVGEATADNQLRVTDAWSNKTLKNDSKNTLSTSSTSSASSVSNASVFNAPIDVPMAMLLHEMPRQERSDTTRIHDYSRLSCEGITFEDALRRVLRHPTVADKTFLITIGDRSVGGLVARDQCVGPWQIPVSDVGVTCADYCGYAGEAMSVGERPPIACFNPAASARLAVAEALTNLAAADLTDLSQVIFSANWMVAANVPGQGAALYQAVQSITTDVCPALGISIPVGKDSTSMACQWETDDGVQHVVSPLSLVISALGLVHDVRRTWTPVCQLTREGDTDTRWEIQKKHQYKPGDEYPSGSELDSRDHPVSSTQLASQLLLIDLSNGHRGLSGSILAQCYQALAHDAVPDLHDVQQLKAFMAAMRALHQTDYVLAYHDRSDGGLMTTLCEMMFASHCGLVLSLSALGVSLSDINVDGNKGSHAGLLNHPTVLAALFNEELGAVIQVADANIDAVMEIFARHQLSESVYSIARVTASDELQVMHGDQVLWRMARTTLQAIWSELSYRMQALRDDPACARSAYTYLTQTEKNALSTHVTFDWLESAQQTPYLARRPKVAILREQGVNGHLEMAAAFDAAGFDAVDVHMSDLLSGACHLDDFAGLAACGGFSYGDVLGAGRGWAQSILMHDTVREVMTQFFARQDRFVLGICNGCQLLAALQPIIPGATDWPMFHRNTSEQYEARVVMTEVLPSRSIFFNDMAGSVLPVIVAHGEGRAVWPMEDTLNDKRNDKLNDKKSVIAERDPSDALTQLSTREQLCLRYVDAAHRATTMYPLNPNGSPGGATGFCNTDGRILLMMPHPERVIRPTQLSWHPSAWRHRQYTPWIKLFSNAYTFVQQC